MSKIVWTNEQEDFLRAQIGKGKHLKQIRIKGKLKGQIDRKIRALRKAGEDLAVGELPWSGQEDLSLIEQVEHLNCQPRDVEIRDSRGNLRSYNAVKGELACLRADRRITKTFVNRGREQPCTIQELRLIKKLTLEAESGDRLGSVRLSKLPELRHRKPSSIQGIIKRYHLGADEKLSERAKLARKSRMSATDRKLFISFLLNTGRFWPSQVLTDKFGIKQDVVSRVRKREGLKLVHSEAMKDPVYRRYFRKKNRFRLSVMKKNFQKKLNEERKLMREDRRDWLQEHERNTLRRCAVCGEKFRPDETAFRHTSRKNKSGLASTSLSFVCRACPVKGERQEQFRQNWRRVSAA